MISRPFLKSRWFRRGWSRLTKATLREHKAELSSYKITLHAFQTQLINSQSLTYDHKFNSGRVYKQLFIIQALKIKLIIEGYHLKAKQFQISKEQNRSDKPPPPTQNKDWTEIIPYKPLFWALAVSFLLRLIKLWSINRTTILKPFQTRENKWSDFEKACGIAVWIECLLASFPHCTRLKNANLDF